MAEWRKYCRGPRLRCTGNEITVTLERERSQRLTVSEVGDEIYLRAVVARRAAVEMMGDPRRWIWRRNHSSRLISFQLDARGALIGECRFPLSDFEEQEFLLYVHTLAAECDRAEHVLTGRDVE